MALKQHTDLVSVHTNDAVLLGYKIPDYLISAAVHLRKLEKDLTDAEIV